MYRLYSNLLSNTINNYNFHIFSKSKNRLIFWRGSSILSLPVLEWVSTWNSSAGLNQCKNDMWQSLWEIQLVFVNTESHLRSMLIWREVTYIHNGSVLSRLGLLLFLLGDFSRALCNWRWFRVSFCTAFGGDGLYLSCGFVHRTRHVAHKQGAVMMMVTFIPTCRRDHIHHQLRVVVNIVFLFCRMCSDVLFLF